MPRKPVVAAPPERMVLFCPKCGHPHYDRGVMATRPHVTHRCESCRHRWYPKDTPTVGVHPDELRSLEISGVWLRGGPGKLEVLCQIEGDWRIAIEVPAPPGVEAITKVAQAEGKFLWPCDPVVPSDGQMTWPAFSAGAAASPPPLLIGSPPPASVGSPESPPIGSPEPPSIGSPSPVHPGGFAVGSTCRPCLGCGMMRRENCTDYPKHDHEWCDCQ